MDPYVASTVIKKFPEDIMQFVTFVRLRYSAVAVVLVSMSLQHGMVSFLTDSEDLSFFIFRVFNVFARIIPLLNVQHKRRS